MTYWPGAHESSFGSVLGLRYLVADPLPATPCDSLEVILGELIAGFGGAGGFSFSIAGLGHMLLSFGYWGGVVFWHGRSFRFSRMTRTL